MREALLNEAPLKEVALQIVQQGLLSNWRFYAVLFALSLVSGAIGAYLSKYFSKRGEIAATKSDFNEIIRQLKETTKVAEEVRSTVSHADWVAREWKTIRRIKLEELVSSAVSVGDWVREQLSVHTNLYIHDDFNKNIEIHPSSSPAKKSSIIAKLYFSDSYPSLYEKCHSLFLKSIEMQLIFNKSSQEFIENKNYDILKKTDWRKQYEIVLACINEVQDESAKIMNELCYTISSLSPESI